MKFRLLPVLVALTAGLTTWSSANAAVLDFEGQGYANYDEIAQGYGDIPGQLEVSYADLSGVVPSLRYFLSGYTGLTGVAWSGSSDANSSGQITLDVLPGYSLTLHSFDLGVFTPNTPTNTTSFRAYELGGPAPAFSTLSGFGFKVTPTFNLSSTAGIVIEWKESAYNVGLDNVNFSVTAVPEPETYAMMLAGLGALGFMSRRRRQD